MIHEFTSDQITETIAHAIREHDFEVVPALIRLLAVQDPARAQEVLDTVELARTLAKGSRPQPDHVCDTCRQSCQGGCRDYRDPTGRSRHGCDDDRACLAAFKARTGGPRVPD